MNKKVTKNDTKPQINIQLINEKQLAKEAESTNASLLLNPEVTWAKFVLTDDMPNGNNQRIPFEEFDNIIKTGTYMPVKMYEGSIENHEDSKPLGVITNIRKEEIPNGHRLIALAVLWGSERPADIEYIKHVMEERGEVNVSWEIKYGKKELEANGIQALRDLLLKAVAIVKTPAYEGRTRFLAIAAKADLWSPAYIEELPDSSFLYIKEGTDVNSGDTAFNKTRLFPIKDATGMIDISRLEEVINSIENTGIPESDKEGVRNQINSIKNRIESGESLYYISFGEELPENTNTEDYELETLEQLKQTLEEREASLANALAAVEENKIKFSELAEQFSKIKTENETMGAELAELREFKASIEGVKAREESLANIKSKFMEAGIEKEEDYFTKSADLLLNLDANELEFMIQELAAFAKEAEASLRNTTVPNLTLNDQHSIDVKELAKALKERKSK